jgi:hypothetical protein
MTDACESQIDVANVRVIGMNDQPKIESALALVLSSTDLRGLVAEYAELGLDALLESGVARDIPFVSTAVGLARVGVAMRDRLFMKKILDFLGPMSAMRADERRAMIEKLEQDSNYGRKVGEHLTELIDKIETHKKPRMLARVLRAHGAGEIDTMMLHQLFHAVEHLPAFAIPAVRKFREGPRVSGNDVTTQLYLGMAGLAVPQSSFDALTYDPTPIAEAFLRLDLDRQE